MALGLPLQPLPVAIEISIVATLVTFISREYAVSLSSGDEDEEHQAVLQSIAEANERQEMEGAHLEEALLRAAAAVAAVATAVAEAAVAAVAAAAAAAAAGAVAGAVAAPPATTQRPQQFRP